MSPRRQVDEGQPATRRPGIVYDQHRLPGIWPEGRPWRCEIDNRSGLPLGPFQPLGWRAPWLPPQGAKVFLCDENNPTRITINYDHVIAEDEAAAKEADESRKAAAAARGWDHEDPEKQDLLDKVSQPRNRTRRPELAYAAKMGDKWILGASPVENAKLKALLPTKLVTDEVRHSRYAAVLVEDEPASLADDLEGLMDLQEEYQSDDTPRGRVPVKPKRQKRTPQLDPAA